MQRVINEGGQAGYEALLHILESAIPVSEPPLKLNSNGDNENNYGGKFKENYSVSYNYDTGMNH